MMRYLKREILTSASPNRDARWNRELAKYKKHLAEILPKMSPAARKFNAWLSKQDLHDQTVARIDYSRERKELIVSFWNIQDRIIFRGVKQITTDVDLGEAIEIAWLYEEFELNSPALIEFTIMFDTADLSLIAREVEVLSK